MIVCICHGVTDKKISELAERGLKSTEEVSRECGAGKDCGSCVFKVEKILNAKVPNASKSSGHPSSNSK